MNSLLCRTLSAYLVTLAIAACTPATSSPGVPPELKHSWEENFNKGDAAAVAALYAPDAELIMSGSETAKGAAAIRAAVEGMIKSGVKAHISSSQNVGAGDVAYVSGTYTIDGGKGGAVAERGAYVEVWRRNNGAWKIVIDINASAPMPTATAIAPADSAATEH